jgi:hypothetical protein
VGGSDEEGAGENCAVAIVWCVLFTFCNVGLIGLMCSTHVGGEKCIQKV